MNYSVALLSLFFMGLTPAQASVKVVTSVTDLKYLVQVIGKDKVEVESIGKGTQDPHFIDAKPSFMTRVSRADLVVCIGLGLEDAWLNSVIEGARNPAVRVNAKGYLAVGPKLKPEEIPQGAALSRSQGDVHPEGNPHVLLDPKRFGEAGLEIAKKLSELDVPNEAFYTKNAQAYANALEQKTTRWKARVLKTGIKRAVTYHRTLDYFLNRMGLELLTVLEPKPGIAPSVNHLSEVIETMKQKDTRLVLVENFFNPDVARKVKELNPAAKVGYVPVSVEGAPEMTSMDAVYENLVQTIESSAQGNSK
jgi:zinc/manganese transport system substrate-binding protein